MATRSTRRLRPWREYDENEVINIFALNGTGLAGALVKVSTLVPSSGYFWSNDAVGASFPGITSNRWENPARIVIAGSGDSRFNGVLGFTLANVQEYDENGQKLILGFRRKADENNAVLSGETVPVVCRGFFQVSSGMWAGAANQPTPGYAATISYAATTTAGGNGFLDCVPLANIQTTGNPNAAIYTNDQVIGTWLSSPGTEQLGYAFLKLAC